MNTARTNRLRMIALATLVGFSSTSLPAWGDPTPPAPPAGPSRQNVALAAVGVAAAGAVAATVFGVLALQNKSDYQKAPTYANTDNGNDFAAYSDGCIALAIAAGVTGLVLFLTNPSAAPPNQAPVLAASPVVTAHGAGAGATLRF